jgi:hypothetical protein
MLFQACKCQNITVSVLEVRGSVDDLSKLGVPSPVLGDFEQCFSTFQDPRIVVLEDRFSAVMQPLVVVENVQEGWRVHFPSI